MKKVILVDDEKLVAEAIRRQVDWESCGAVLCRVCLNAFEALKAVEEVRPDIIITDIKMPVMDGWSWFAGCGSLIRTRNLLFCPAMGSLNWQRQR